jgi:hypothetical protein
MSEEILLDVSRLFGLNVLVDVDDFFLIVSHLYLKSSEKKSEFNSQIKSTLHRNSSERAWIGASTLPSTKALNKWREKMKGK